MKHTDSSSALDTVGTSDTALKSPATSWVYPILMFGLFANGVGQTMLFSVLAPIAHEIGFAEIQVGIIIAASAATTAIVSPFWGRQADRIGRKTVFVFGLAMYGVTSLIFGGLFALALDRTISVLLTFFLAVLIRVTYAALVAGLQPSAMALTASITTEKTRASGMALVGGAFSVGAVAGPMLGGIMTTTSLVAPIYVGGAFALVASVLAWAFLQEGKEPTFKTARKPLHFMDQRIVYVFLSCIFYFTCFAIMQQTVPFYLQERFGLDAVNTAHYTGFSMTALASAMIVAQMGFVSWLKWKPESLLYLGCLLSVAGLLLFLWSGSLFLVVASHIIVGFGFGLIYPALQASASIAVDPSEQGAVAGLMGTAAAIGYIAGPLIGTGLFSLLGWLPFVVALVLSVASLSIYQIGRHILGRKPTS